MGAARGTGTGSFDALIDPAATLHPSPVRGGTARPPVDRRPTVGARAESDQDGHPTRRSTRQVHQRSEELDRRALREAALARTRQRASSTTPANEALARRRRAAHRNQVVMLAGIVLTLPWLFVYVDPVDAMVPGLLEVAALLLGVGLFGLGAGGLASAVVRGVALVPRLIPVAVAGFLMWTVACSGTDPGSFVFALVPIRTSPFPGLADVITISTAVAAVGGPIFGLRSLVGLIAAIRRAARHP